MKTGLVSGGNRADYAAAAFCGNEVQRGSMSIHRLRRRSHNKGSGSAYRGLTCVALAALACAAPGVARAHGGGHFVAGPAATPPTIDGVVGGSEWAAATPYTVPFGSLGNGTIRFLHTPTQLYISGVVTDVSPGLTPSLGVFFDNDHDGVKEPGDDEWRARISIGTGGLDRFYSPTGSDGPAITTTRPGAARTRQPA